MDADKEPRCTSCRRRHRIDLPCWRPPYSTNLTAIVVPPGARCWLNRRGCEGVASVVDHIVPRSQGGTDDMSNLRPACGPCNTGRADREPFAVETPTRATGVPISARWRD